MYAQVEKPKEYKSRAVTNPDTQKKSTQKQGFGFVDNRPEVVVQRELQKKANVYPQAKQLNVSQKVINQTNHNKLSNKNNYVNRHVIQMRSDNPYEEKGEHKGYELTAHHIVPYSKLILAQKLLKNYDNAPKDISGDVLLPGSLNQYTGAKLDGSILKNSITDTLTKENLVNIGIFSEGQKAHIENAWLGKIVNALKGNPIQETLTSTTDSSLSLIIDANTINGNNCDQYRQSFYEWQGGNQFMGPNTDFREEPGNKDQIDFDAQWITSMSSSNFEKLTGLKQSKHKNISTPDVSSSSDIDKTGDNGVGLQLIDFLSGKGESDILSKTNVTKLEGILTEILSLTKNVSPDAFDASLWKEVSTEDDYNKLEGNQSFGGPNARKWGRSGEGVAEHTFFILKLGDLSSLTRIKAGSGQSSTASYAYEGTDIEGSKQKGTYIYIPVKGSRDIKAAPVVVNKNTLEALVEVGVVASGDAGNSNISIDDSSTDLTFSAAGGSGERKFVIKGYTMSQIFIGNKTGIFTLPKDTLTGKQASKVTSSPISDSLFKYCQDETDINFSTYLPKGLYDWLNQ